MTLIAPRTCWRYVNLRAVGIPSFENELTEGAGG